MKGIIRGAVLLAALSIQANPALPQNAAACELPPNLVSPLETGPFIVSTYHTTGVAGSDRVIQVQWPREIANPLSGVPPGREDGANRTLLFHIPSGSVSVPSESGEMIKIAFPKFSMSVGLGVDLYPLYSDLGSVGDMPSTGGRPLLKSPSGHTYHSSEGFETFPNEDHGDWVRYAYPGPSLASNRSDTFFRGVPEVDGVEAILSCDRWEDGPTAYSQCKLFKKLEPIFYRSTIKGSDFEHLPVIEFVADRLMECVIGEL